MITHVAVIIDGEVVSMPKPARHHEILHKFPRANHNQGPQGFIDDKEGFVGRRRAATLAMEADQIEEINRPLYSEDLW
ncbi:MAG: hypothetical protein G3M70_07195 [Candidatus Nitronauta litoralis]|uniref:Uncharacterized protein n=1 Tax=Candidatus Nitronauta litoralis TaxID=2705533 RepID=A0A7T0BVA8_9BACT|nr:MAG: hypothetical protein G3M70_07195 [Candidatus Nitronauta litoralis]